MKKLLVLSLIAIALALASFTFLASRDTGKLTRRNYDRIQLGMTLNDVESILGQGEDVSGRFGAVKRGDKTYQWEVPHIVQGEKAYKWEEWSIRSNGTFNYKYGERTIYVGFQDGKVCDKDYWQPSF